MEDLNRKMGALLRQCRLEKGLSQEALGALAGFHFTYIGQVERGEKNIPLLSLERIAAALDLSLFDLFEKLQGRAGCPASAIPREVYELTAAQSLPRQAQLYGLIREFCRYGEGSP